MPSNFDPCQLHIPHKGWTDNPQEKQNYDEIERWSTRLKGCGARGEGSINWTRSTVTGIANGTIQTVVSLFYNFLPTRKYDIIGTWTGLSTDNPTAPTQVEMIVTVGGANMGQSYQTPANPWSCGGQITVRYVVPGNSPVNTFVNLDCQNNGPGQASVLGSTASPIVLQVLDIGTIYH